MRNTLLPCPFCGGEAEINRINHCYEWLYEARCPDCGCGTDGCDEEWRAAEMWNRRTQPENKPLTLEELRQMDGQPVYIIEHPNWGHWELSCDAEDYIQDRDEDFYGMTCNAIKDGWCSGTCKYGLHNMGWLAYRHKPERSEG